MSRPWVKFFLKHPEASRRIMQALRDEAVIISQSNGNKKVRNLVDEDLRDRFEKETFGV